MCMRSKARVYLIHCFVASIRCCCDVQRRTLLAVKASGPFMAPIWLELTQLTFKCILMARHCLCAAYQTLSSGLSSLLALAQTNQCLFLFKAATLQEYLVSIINSLSLLAMNWRCVAYVVAVVTVAKTSSFFNSVSKKDWYTAANVERKRHEPVWAPSVAGVTPSESRQRGSASPLKTHAHTVLWKDLYNHRPYNELSIHCSLRLASWRTHRWRVALSL